MKDLSMPKVLGRAAYLFSGVLIVVIGLLLNQKAGHSISVLPIFLLGFGFMAYAVATLFEPRPATPALDQTRTLSRLILGVVIAITALVFLNVLIRHP